MDLKKYEEVLDNISEIVVPTYFNNDKSKYNEAKSLILSALSKDSREEIFDSHPFFRYYLRNNFVLLCKIAPNFIGSVLSTTFKESFSELVDFGKSYIKLYHYTLSKNKIKTAETLYDENRKYINIILQSSEILKDDIDKVLIAMEPLYNITYYWHGRFLYTYLMTELEFGLKFLSRIDNLDEFIFSNKIVIAHYFNLLKSLGELRKREFQKYSFIQKILEDLENIYKKIEEYQSNQTNTSSYISNTHDKNFKTFIPIEKHLISFKYFEENYGFIARSEEMYKVFEFIQDNKDNISIIITGETGVGKEVVAKTIHYESNRSKGPYITYDCSGEKPQIVESKLFGHEKGAYTDAHKQRIGIFELANGGTVFLDEIGETSSDLQVKLLRVLQEKELTRMGGTEIIKVDFRLICATNKNLSEEVQKKRFREDLYFRIYEESIEIPQLDKRKEDIPFLANHFFNKYQNEFIPDQYTRAPNWVEINTFNVLKEEEWPGNVRELEKHIKVIVNKNKDLLCKLTPDFFRKILKDRSITIKSLLNDKTNYKTTFRTDQHFIALKEFINSGFSRKEAQRSLNIKTRDTFKKRLQSSILQVGSHHEFDIERIVRYLISIDILDNNKKQQLKDEIKYIFVSIIKSKLNNTKKDFVDPADKDLINDLFESKKDIVEQIKHNKL